MLDSLRKTWSLQNFVNGESPEFKKQTGRGADSHDIHLLHRPVNEHNDEDNEGDDGRPDSNPNLSLQGEGGQAQVVILDLPQGEVQVAHLNLEITHTHARTQTAY